MLSDFLAGHNFASKAIVDPEGMPGIYGVVISQMVALADAISRMRPTAKSSPSCSA